MTIVAPKLLITSAIMAAISLTAFAEDSHTPIYNTASPTLAAYTPGIVTENGTLYVSGNIAYVNGAIPAHASDGKNDMADQAKIVMDNIKKTLDNAGYTFDDAVKVSVFMTDIANYGEFNNVYATYWPKGDTPPAREAMQIGALPGSKPGAPVLVEVSLIAQK